MKRASLLIAALSVVIMGAVTLPAVAANSNANQPKLTSQQLQAKRQAYHTKLGSTTKAGNHWWDVLRDLGFDKADATWPTGTIIGSGNQMADVAHVIANLKGNYKDALAYYNAKIATPKDAKYAYIWEKAQANIGQPLRVLRHFAPQMEKQDVVTEFNKLNPNLAYTGYWAFWAIKYLPKDQAKKLIIAAVKQHGANPASAKRIKLWQHVITCIGTGLITQAEAKSMVFMTKLKVMNRLSKMKPDNKAYAPLKQYASQVATLYDQLK